MKAYSLEEARVLFPDGEVHVGGYIYVDGVLVFDGMYGMTKAGEELLAKSESKPKRKPKLNEDLMD